MPVVVSATGHLVRARKDCYRKASLVVLMWSVVCYGINVEPTELLAVQSLLANVGAPPTIATDATSNCPLANADGSCAPSSIACNAEGRVTCINLFGNGTSFGGPTSLGRLPDDAFASLPSLGFLRLANRCLKDVLPSSVGLLAKLDTLDLSGNCFRGVLPLSLGKLTRLRTCSVGGPQSIFCCPTPENLPAICSTKCTKIAADCAVQMPSRIGGASVSRGGKVDIGFSDGDDVDSSATAASVASDDDGAARTSILPEASAAIAMSLLLLVLVIGFVLFRFSRSAGGVPVLEVVPPPQPPTPPHAAPFTLTEPPSTNHDTVIAAPPLFFPQTHLLAEADDLASAPTLLVTDENGLLEVPLSPTHGTSDSSSISSWSPISSASAPSSPSMYDGTRQLAVHDASRNSAPNFNVQPPTLVSLLPPPVPQRRTSGAPRRRRAVNRDLALTSESSSSGTNVNSDTAVTASTSASVSGAVTSGSSTSTSASATCSMVPGAQLVCPYAPACTRTFRYHSKLQQHLKSHVDDRPFACTECDRRFKRHDALARHVREVHEQCKRERTAPSERKRRRANPSGPAISAKRKALPNRLDETPALHLVDPATARVSLFPAPHFDASGATNARLYGDGDGSGDDDNADSDSDDNVDAVEEYAQLSYATAV